MKLRLLLPAGLLFLCLLPTGCRSVPAMAEGTPALIAPAAPSPSFPAADGPKTAMDWERWYNAEEILKGKVYMTPPPWLTRPVG